MEWVERLNVAMNYIEEHLDQEIDLKEVAKIACCRQNLCLTGLKSIIYPLQHGQYLQVKERINQFKTWKKELSQNGFRHQDMSMEMPQILKYI